MNRFLLVPIALLIASTGYSSGQVGIAFSDYERAKTTEVFQTYVASVGEGYLWANVALIERGQEPLFCPPPKVKLGYALYNAILTKRILEHGAEIKPDMSIGLILLTAMQEAYPCNN